MSHPLAGLLATLGGNEFQFGDYRVRKTRDVSHLDEAFRLRHKVYADRGFIDSNAFANGVFVDEFDESSEHVLVFDADGTLVGTMRVVLPSARGFPTERLFDFDPPAVDRSKLGEFGRVAIEGTHRGGRRIVTLGMLKAAAETMIEERLTHVFAFCSPQLADSYASLGCTPIPLCERKLSRETRRNRSYMSGYFDKQVVQPFLFSLEDFLRDHPRAIGLANHKDKRSVPNPESPRAFGAIK